MEEVQEEKTPWIAASAAVAGRKHRKYQMVCQDQTYILETPSVIAAALADGASSASYSDCGAKFVSMKVCEILTKQFDELYFCPEQEVRNTILSILLEGLKNIADDLNCKIVALSSTLLAVAICKGRFMVLQLGDGVLASVQDQKLQLVTEPQNGEYVGRTYFVTYPYAFEKLQVKKGECTHMDGFIMMSDGSAACLYRRQSREVAPVLARLVGRLGVTSREYMEAILKESLENTISKKIKSGDDCSLVLVSKRQEEVNDTEKEG